MVVEVPGRTSIIRSYKKYYKKYYKNFYYKKFLV